MNRAALSVLLRAALPAVALAFGLRGVDWRTVATTLRFARPGPLLALVGVNAVMMTVRGARLRLLLGRAASLRTCLLAKLTASAMNNVVPFRGGDLARLWMLQRHAQVSKTVAGAVAVIESLFELASLASVALAGAVVARQRWAVVAAATLAALAAAALLTAWRLARQPGTGLGPAATAIGQRLRQLRARVQPGLRPLRLPGVFPRALAASILGWLLEVIMLALCARALHLPVSPALAAVVLLAINVAVAVPSSPAGAGAFEGAVVFVLALSGMGRTPAVAFALLYHLIQVVPVVLAGALVVWRSGLTLDRLPPPGPIAAADPHPVTSAIARPSHPLRPTV